MATTMLLRTLTRRRCSDLLSSSSSSQSLSAAAAAACTKWLTSDVKKPLARTFPLGKHMASLGRPFSSKPTAGNSMEEENVEDFDGEASLSTYPWFDDLLTENEVKGPWEVRYGDAWMDAETVPFDQARVAIFKRLKEKAKSASGYAISRAVVKVPANVNDTQLHEMIKDAATTAGLDVQRIIVNEPAADAYPYGLQLKHGNPITTFDFTDPMSYTVRVNQFHEGKETDCDNMLEWVVDYMKRELGVGFTKYPSALQRLPEALQKASVSKSNIKIRLPVADGDRIIEKTVTKRDLPW